MRWKGFRIPVAAVVGVAMLLALAWGVRATMAQPAQSPITIPTISGNIGTNAIQIDDLDNNVNTTPNANMITGGETDLDCVDPSPAGEVDSNCPATGLTYIDWNSLVAGGPLPPGKHRVIDGTGSTDDSFAGTPSKSCLQPAHAAPQKEDILRVYLANNSQYFYFGEVDKAPQGDSRHVFLLHKNAVTEDSAFCAGDGHDISVDLDPGDKLILAVFKPSAATPAAQLYDLVGDPGSLLMNQATDFSNTGRWTPISGVANFAVNTTAIPDDALADNGLPATVPLAAEVFGEGAVSLNALGITACGGVYNISIVTRSSGSGGGEPKDYVGAAYNFGSVTVEASLTATCDLDINFNATATGPDGTDITTSATWIWNFTPNTTPDNPNTASGSVTAPSAGSYSATATATFEGCSDTATTASVEVYAPVGAAADLTASCNLTIPYAGIGSDGSGSYDFAWAFSGPGGTTPSSSASPSGSFNGTAPGGLYTGNLTVTDAGRADSLVCTATASDSAAGFPPVGATADLTPSCNLTVPYAGNGSGGTGSYGFAWAFSGSGGTTPSSSTTASGSFNGAAPGGLYTGDLTVTDTGRPDSEICTATDSDSAQGFSPLGVVVDAVPACTLTFATNSTVTGGSGSVGHAWSKVSGPGSLPFANASAEDTTATASSAGTYVVRDTVTDLRADLPAGTCTASDTDSVAVSVLGATATLTDTCNLTLPYSSSVSGELGTVSYAWTFSGPTGVTPSSSAAASGTAAVTAPGGTGYTGNLTVTDARTDSGSPSIGGYECTAPASDTADVFGPITATIAPNTNSLVCPAVDAGTAISYTATVGGGQPPYTYLWSVTGDNVAPACGNIATCLVDSAPANYCALITVQVNVDDSFGLCPAVDSNIGEVTKETTVTATP